VRLRILGATAVALAVLGLVACGGGDNDKTGAASIRTDKGLAVAAVSAGFDPARNGSSNKAASDSQTGESAPAAAATRAQSGLSGAADAKQAFAVNQAPALQQNATGITVQGYGSATAAADSAVVEFYFNTANKPGIEPQPAPVPGSSSSSSAGSGSTPGIAVGEPAPVPPDATQQQTVEPITEATLQPIIDALVGAGVARADIQFLNAYADVYSSSATLRATVRNLGSVDAVVQAGTNAAAGLTGATLGGTNISYTAGDCSALEKAAMAAAVEDARSRGAAFAETLGVKMGGVIGASHYAYSPYGGSPCGSNYGGPIPLGGVPYNRGGSTDVQVFTNISVTYAIE